MTKQIRLNALVGNGATHPVPGLWTGRPSANVGWEGFADWTRLARRLEDSRFDNLVIIDTGLHRGLAGGVPQHDPLVLVSALAHDTRHLGFGVSANTAGEIPAVLARRFSSLDHLTQGRIGWHILPAAAGGLAPDDAERFERADEFLEIAYRLWQGSWQPGSVVRDRESGVFAIPEKVHRVVHSGKYFYLDTFHLTEPSPQRTPFLLVDAAAPDERSFAARHAEAAFIKAPDAKATADIVSDIRKRAVQVGREPGGISHFASATLIVGHTDEEARAKLDGYRAWLDREAALVFFAQETGVDLSGVDPHAPVVSSLETEAGNAVLAAARRVSPGGNSTVHDLAAYTALAAGGALFLGAPEQIADDLENWVEGNLIDGFNLVQAPTPEPFADIVDLIVPELQRRGSFKRDYAEGTLREKFLGQPYPESSHPADTFSGVPRI